MTAIFSPILFLLFLQHTLALAHIFYSFLFFVTIPLFGYKLELFGPRRHGARSSLMGIACVSFLYFPFFILLVVFIFGLDDGESFSLFIWDSSMTGHGI
ncbi:hypothetical protein B0T19DRAFT_178407 [Cercophora scortea]|uniref:Uncharacterized protein n=1 Tax=Cercophora scortea TaxID=314031 RepID=A0AAE0IMY6_9PEZI|nr:hypothetical protein B0T19DRAFT_178407 [Cercophora scortea]